VKPIAKLLGILASGALLSASVRASAQISPDFETAVAPVLAGTCAQCHNDRLASGGFSVAGLAGRESLATHRGDWEKILRRVRAGEMPPSPSRLPESAAAGFVDALQAAFARADAAAAPDPGRVTARRLNRNEYSNTIRDLLAVDFRAEKYFPTDDSGDGFDNIGEVLTVSTALMERYMSAAERIARWAISTEVPPKPIVDEYHLKERKVRRVDAGTIEAVHRVEYAGEYTVRFGLPGERAPNGKPVTLNLWIDGKLLQARQIQTKPSGLVYFNPYSEEEMRVYLTEGDHVFRAGFTNDDFVQTLASSIPARSSTASCRCCAARSARG
jgi:mono/diheme cytochrome c family protein